MRATFYARVSSDSEEQKNSIISQVQYFNDMIASNNYQRATDCGVFCKRDGTAEATNGYYVDEGFSGAKSVKYRKAFLQMIKDAKARKFDIILIKNISRFGRNVQEILKFIGDLREVGVGVFFEDVNINTLNRTDDVKITIFSALAEEESRAKSDAVQFGKMQGYKNGVWGGREPYGYNIKEGKLVVNEQEAQIVKEVFDLYLNQSMGLRNIAKILNERGVPTKSGKTIFDQSLISKLLKNAVYTGEIRLHRTQKIDINRNIVKKVPKSEQIVTHDESLRIIDDETFNLAQMEKEKRFEKFGDFKYRNALVQNDEGEEVTKKVRTIVRGDSRHSNKHLFSNLLKCGNCGGSLRRKVQKNHKNTFIYWFCRNNDNFGKSKCKHRNLQHEEKLIEYVKSEINNYKNSPKTADYYLNSILNTRFNTTNLEERISNIKTDIGLLKEDRELNFNLYARKKIDENEYDERSQKIADKLYDTESTLNRLLYIEDEIAQTKLRFEQFTKALNDVDVDNLTNALLRKFIDRIVATTFDEPFEEGIDFGEKHTLTIEFNFMGENVNELRRADIKHRLANVIQDQSDELTDEKLEAWVKYASREPDQSDFADLGLDESESHQAQKEQTSLTK
ncbi:recombinase family protein [Paenibacillus sp.]|uniref:recombinase family protein n=1 Tax=Paenibacillus sp. TaxID=58172 RepID=UPI002825FF30|nr:recombinase family protein [Paenibacillus sp.]MDR0269859.1 recombinase family protein [Paenibacillus sp.]